jgi:hypothetical protein
VLGEALRILAMEDLHGKAVAIEKDGECAFSEGSPSVCVVFCPLIVAVFALIALFFVDVSIFDEVFVLTFWTVHNREPLCEVRIDLRQEYLICLCSSRKKSV